MPLEFCSSNLWSAQRNNVAPEMQQRQKTTSGKPAPPCGVSLKVKTPRGGARPDNT
ncbi:hypothetical protein HMPREF9554_01499 [Treponema phagedenis F0421]|nr:hypothetical protein HMPREF9554_01499 [Treponema phagedenis F0421]